MASIAAGEEMTVGRTAPPAAAPAARRIEALDFVRGVALCGILLLISTSKFSALPASGWFVSTVA